MNALFWKELVRFISIVMIAVFYYGTEYLLKTYAPNISPDVRKITSGLAAVLICILLVWLEG